MNQQATTAFAETEIASSLAQKSIVMIMKDGSNTEQHQSFMEMFVTRLQDIGERLGFPFADDRPNFPDAANAHGLPREAQALNILPTDQQISPFRIMNEGGAELKALAVLAGIESMVFRTDENNFEHYSVGINFQRLHSAPSEEYPFILE